MTEEQDREVFFSKIFRIYASVLFCCVAGVIWLCRPMMHLFKAEYYDGWIFVPFLTLCSMCTCLNHSIYVVYKRSTGSLVTMLCGAVLNLILNYCFILAWGPWGVTPASFLGLLLVFLLRAYSTRGLLEVDFHPGWLLLNLALVLAEIFCIMAGKLGHPGHSADGHRLRHQLPRNFQYAEQTGGQIPPPQKGVILYGNCG